MSPPKKLAAVISTDERKFIREAAAFLEKPGIFIRTVNALGQPIESLQSRLPVKAQELIRNATERSLEEALKLALKTMTEPTLVGNFEQSQRSASFQDRLHTIGAAMTGAVGGFFGVVSLPVELPLTTALMLRSIAQIARSFGADPRSPTTQLECLYVFSLGAPAAPAMETSYYGARLGLSQLMKQASKYIAQHTTREIIAALQKGTAPVLVRLIANIASRFEVAVTEKILSEALPIVGAAGGALVNTTFTHYFNEAAKYHFGLRRLEEAHGQAVVQKLYRQLIPGRS
jgi:hypothetical protein